MNKKKKKMEYCKQEVQRVIGKLDGLMCLRKESYDIFC